VFGLASWVGSLLGPAIRTYHSRTTRRELEHEIPRLVRQGSLPELFDLIENPERRQQDVQGYADAEDHFEAAETEVAEIEGEDESWAEHAQAVGRQSAAMSSVIMFFLFAGIYFMLTSY
jgi:hypothetical protein